MEEMIVIPRQELPADVQFYKGELTGNALLNHAGQVAAQKKRLLHDKTLSAQEIVQRVKPLGRELHRCGSRKRSRHRRRFSQYPVRKMDATVGEKHGTTQRTGRTTTLTITRTSSHAKT